MSIYLCIWIFFSIFARRKEFYMNKQQYIEAHKNMFWYTPADKKAEISDALLRPFLLTMGRLLTTSRCCKCWDLSM